MRLLGIPSSLLLAAPDPGLFDFLDGVSALQIGAVPVLFCAALLVLWYGRKQFARHSNTAAIRPRGRVLREYVRMRPERWRKQVIQLEHEAPTPLDRTRPGPVRLQGVLTGASETLGGAPGRECVWRNREGARPDSAVAAELVFLSDGTGKCGIEGLESAHVIAPPEKLTVHHESVSLYLGDRVEVFGIFVADKVEDERDPTQSVYGTLTAKPALDVRLLGRDDAGTESSTSPPSSD